MINYDRTRARARRGVSIVEAAIILPLLFMLLFGMLEYGWVFLNTQELGAAARHGARLGIVEGATAADVTEAVESILDGAGLGASGYQLTLDPTDPSTLLPGQPLTVTVQVTYGNIELIGIPLIPTPDTIEGSVTMAKEGPL